MLSTVRNMLKILYDRKVGAVIMLSGFMENGQVIAYITNILLRRRGYATPIVTVQISKFFSITRNSNVAANTHQDIYLVQCNLFTVATPRH